MRVLIAGAAGFIGSHLSDRFLADGYEVVGVDNFITGNPANLAHLEDHAAFTFIEQDITTPFIAPGPFDAVLNFASPASPIDYLKHPLETLEVGSTGTRNLLNIAKENNARFFQASTSEVYGDPLEHPQRETYWGNVNPIGPRSCYDEAKRFSEALVMAYHRTYGLQTRIIRIFNTYGPRMRSGDGRVVPNFIVQAIKGQPLTVYGDGSQTRSFTYVDDLVEGVVRILRSDDVEPFNIGNPVEFSIKEFADLLNEITGNEAGTILQPKNRIKDDPQTRQPDITRARQLLGWEPTVNVREGLARTIEYFRSVTEG